MNVELTSQAGDMSTPEPERAAPPQPEPTADPHVSADDVSEDPGSGDAVPTQATAPPGRRWTSILPWVLVGLLAATTIAATWAWRDAAGLEQTRSDVESAVTGLAIDLVTWDATSLDQTAQQLRARGTGEFLDQVDEVIATAKELTAAVEGSSRGEVLDLLVDVDGDRAVAVVIVRQTLRAAGQESSDEQVMRVELVDVDGAWLVDEVELINVPVPVTIGEEPS